MERRAIIIVGPTASGKSNVALQLAAKINSEIISADSRQFYKYLNIGTAKVSEEVLKIVKHHFVDSLELTDYYNASRFEKEATNIINKLHSKGKIPIIAGGSGLYIQAIVDGLLEHIELDEEYRSHLIELREANGNEFIYNLLLETDPKTAKTMLPQNWKRVIRALEVYKLTGQSIVDLHEKQSKNSEILFYQFGLDWPREILYKRINDRVDEMISHGLVEETESILIKGYDKNLNSLNTVGYKEIISYLMNEITLERAVELIKRNTRRYAKRQLTWFRKDQRINWIKVADDKDLESASSKIYDKIR